MNVIQQLFTFPWSVKQKGFCPGDWNAPLGVWVFHSHTAITSSKAKRKQRSLAV